MRPLVRLGAAVGFAALLVLAWLLVRERPILPAREPSPRILGTTPLYLDRGYRFEALPDALREAVVVPTTRHDHHDVHLRLTEPGTVVLLTVDERSPLDDRDWAPLPIAGLRVPGAAVDLTRAWSCELTAGDHLVSPRVPTRIASPVLVLAGGEVRRIETPAGLLRRVELATRGWPRLGIAIVLTLLAATGVLLAVLLSRRGSRPA